MFRNIDIILGSLVLLAEAVAFLIGVAGCASVHTYHGLAEPIDSRDCIRKVRIVDTKYGRLQEAEWRKSCLKRKGK
jgi:hypothetical protein